MLTRQSSDVSRVRGAFFCLIGIIVAIPVVYALLCLPIMVLMGREALQAFRHGPSFRLFEFLVTRSVALAACVIAAGIRTRQDMLTAFAFRPCTPRFLMLAGMAGLWMGALVRIWNPGGFPQIHFRVYFALGSLALLLGPFLEEASMRGFFFPVFRASWGLVPAIILVVSIDVILFHPGILRNPGPLVPVGIVNVVTCLFRQRADSLWPCIAFHLGYNIPFAVLRPGA